MINLVSRSTMPGAVGGTPKVFANLTKGLDRIGYPYVVNQCLDACERLWIQNNTRALPFIPADVKVVLGPSFYTFDLPSRELDENTLYVYPSAPTEAHWSALDLGVHPSGIWPVGVDVDEFPERPSPESEMVLLYYKMRNPAELKMAADMLERRRIPFRLVRYGSYNENEFRELLRQTSFAVWVAGTESQGLAMLEAMASGVPVAVFDCTRYGHNWGLDLDTDMLDAGVTTTSAPYFSHRCGVKASTPEELEQAIDSMRDTWRSYAPRDYVTEELGLEQQARAFVDLWSRWGLTFESGMQERPRRSGQLHLPRTWIAHDLMRRLHRRRYFRRKLLFFR